MASIRFNLLLTFFAVFYILTTGADAITNRLEYRMCRNRLNFGYKNDYNKRKQFIDLKYYAQVNFNILNSEGIKGFIRSKALDRLVFGAMQDLYCAGLGEKISILYTIPFWDDRNKYDDGTTELTTHIPEYYIEKYYKCKNMDYHTIFWAPTANLLIPHGSPLPPWETPLTSVIYNKSPSLVYSVSGKFSQALCPEFTHKYPFCPHYDGLKFYNLNSTKPFKTSYSEELHETIDQKCVDERKRAETVYMRGPTWRRDRQKTIESISAIYGSGFNYGSRPSLLAVDFIINTPGNSNSNKAKALSNIGYAQDYFQKSMSSAHDQDDKRSSFLDSHTYSGSNFYDERTDLDYNYILEDRIQISDQLDLRIPPFNIRGPRPIHERFSFQFNLKRDLLTSFAYVSDIKMSGNTCNYESKVNLAYDDIKDRANKTGGYTFIDNYPSGARVKDKLDDISPDFRCWGDHRATQIVVTVVSDEAQDYSSNPDIMWRLYMSHYEISGPGTLDERIRGWERATGHKFSDFSTRMWTPEMSVRDEALENIAETIAKRDVRHIVVVVDSKNASPYMKFSRRKKDIVSMAHDFDYGYNNGHKLEYQHLRDPAYDKARVEYYHDSSVEITALDFIIGYHGANVYYEDTRRLNIEATLDNLEKMGLGRSLQAMVLRKGGYFGMISANDLQTKPLVPYSQFVDNMSLFDLIESATAFFKHNYKSAEYRNDMEKRIDLKYKSEFPANNRHKDKERRSYINPYYNFIGPGPRVKYKGGECRHFDDIEDLVTHMLLNASSYGFPATSIIPILISQALNNIDRYVEFFYDKLPIGKLMETYYHEPIIIMSKERSWPNTDTYFKSLCSDHASYSDRGDVLEDTFEELLAERSICPNVNMKTCKTLGFIIKLVNNGFDTYTHRPNYKAVLKPFCASKPTCTNTLFQNDYSYPCDSIENCNHVDPVTHPYTIRSTLDNMRVFNVDQNISDGISAAELKSAYIRSYPDTHIPDTFYGDPCGAANSTKCAPSYVKKIIQSGKLAYSSADEKYYDGKEPPECSSRPRVTERPRDYYLSTDYKRFGCSSSNDTVPSYKGRYSNSKGADRFISEMLQSS